jgi:DNA-binding PadR family transcriptional regulator
VLGVLCEQPRHGFALARELAPESDLGAIWTVRRPLVYRAIDHLVTLGLAEPRAVEPGTQGPDRTVMAATRSGRARLARWLDDPVAHPRDVRTELLAKLALRVRRGEPVAPLAQEQLRRFGDVREGVAQKRQAGEGIGRLTMQWRVSANEAIVSFLEAVIRDER